MKTLGITALLVLLAGAWAQVAFREPICDSPEAEEAALAARDYLNGQHTHGYKYELNRIEDIKVYPGMNGNEIYVIEVDLLETNCHVLDPTPLANCTVRPKHLTAVEGDCDVVLNKVGGALSVSAFKCKTEESTEDLCLGCISLLPLNNTEGLDFVHATLAALNNNSVDTSYTILEVGRMSSQVVSGGPVFQAEYVIIEANCTDGVCVPLNDPLAARGFCIAEGVKTSHATRCKMFPTQLMPVVDANGTVTHVPVKPPVVQVHTGSLSRKHGLSHHKLTSFHNPLLSGHLSAESTESLEVVPQAAVVADTATGVSEPVQPDDSAADSSSSREVPVVMFKRDVSNFSIGIEGPIIETGPALFRPRCPGMIRHFD
ncbi:alpha-2-HS-glycoprotein 2 isoform X2 [Cynoglossus semilaevis]|uniref:alpha-2-HS-glycoprotein 2 isoform X2 n=1 Tax=Cynoglossus semilaevis TaxID=244447 RepID=UPI0004960B96|nr:alpha-2-HS-glycoprotein-like isoform X2 [Cynoglossus semilaevis]